MTEQNEVIYAIKDDRKVLYIGKTKNYHSVKSQGKNSMLIEALNDMRRQNRYPIYQIIGNGGVRELQWWIDRLRPTCNSLRTPYIDKGTFIDDGPPVEVKIYIPRNILECLSEQDLSTYILNLIKKDLR